MYPLAFEDHFRALLAGATDPLDRMRRMARFREIIALPIYQYRPLPRARQFHQSRARFRWALGGNRSSKSHALAVETVWEALGIHPWQPPIAPCEQWYATQTWEMVGKILYQEKLKRLLVGIPHEIVWHNKGTDTPSEIRIPVRGGVSRITFKAYEQGRGSFQGRAIPRIRFDEQFPRDVFEEATSRIGGEQELRFSAAMTPVVPQLWLEDMLTAKMPDDWQVFKFPLDDQRKSRGGFLNDEEIDAMIARWPLEVQATRRNGEWGAHQGLIFQTFDYGTHVIHEEEERARFFPQGVLPISLHSVRSIDWGGANPMCVLWGVRHPAIHDDWYIFDEYYWDNRERGQRSLEDHARAILERDREWRANVSRCWADHDPTDAFEMARYGVPSAPADKDVSASIELIQGLLKVRPELQRPRLYVAGRCENLIRQMRTYHYAEGTEIRDPRPEPVKVNDHAVDCLRYMLLSDEGIATVGDIDLGTGRREF